MLKKKVAQFIKTEQLFQKDDKLLVALSGGADSVALLRVLLQLGYEVEAAHCNFHLRGEESERDELFVTKLCKQLDTPLHIVHFDTHAEAERLRISIEMAARQLRYLWFEQLREQCHAKCICVAHHQDDSVETVLLNLIRGTGIYGLCGIKVVNDTIVRPLLCVNREEIADYLKHLGQDYVIDSTNLEDEYTRNKIRLDLLPLMRQINPSVDESIISTAAHLKDAAQIYHEAMENGKLRVMKDQGIDIEALKRETAPGSLLYEILSPLGFNSHQVSDIMQSLDAQSGKIFISGTHQVIKDRALLIISAKVQDKEPNLAYETFERTTDFKINKDKSIACLDAEKIKEPLSLRKYQAGDWFIPYGMKGKKNISDYLTDKKFSLLQKQEQWVLCSGKDIVWLVGERIDNRYCIVEKTKRIMRITMK